jgi:polyphenol oxidase
VTIETFRSSLLEGVPHGFLGRRGGVSTGAYAGLNVGFGSDDDRDAIIENRRRAVASIAPGARLVTVHQTHSADAVYADRAWPDESRPSADAIVTDRPGILLGILTADCTPILFLDPGSGVIGAAHAGWRGALSGIIEATVSAMERIGGERSRIKAAVGPVIARSAYEVDLPFHRRFLAVDPENDRFFSPGREDHCQFDLEAYVLARLAEAGVRRAHALGLDTYSQPDLFYSYRRATHRGEPGYGRQISLIALPGDRSAGHAEITP